MPLKGHTLLDRLSGADKDALSALVEKHGRIVAKPLSHTDQAPAKALPAIPSVEDEKIEMEEELDERLRRLMNQDKVVLFMKGSPDAPRCGFSRKIVGLLRDQGVEFKHFDILTDERVRQGNESLLGTCERDLIFYGQGLKVLNDWPTFPQLIVKGELVGGLDIAQEMVNNGELQSLLKT